MEIAFWVANCLSMLFFVPCVVVCMKETNERMIRESKSRATRTSTSVMPFCFMRLTLRDENVWSPGKAIIAKLLSDLLDHGLAVIDFRKISRSSYIDSLKPDYRTRDQRWCALRIISFHINQTVEIGIRTG